MIHFLYITVGVNNIGPPKRQKSGRALLFNLQTWRYQY